MSFANLIKRLQDVMRKDPGVDGDVQRLNQFVWLIFLKVYDYKEEENELDDNYKPVIPEGYRWRDWANPLTENGEPDVKNQLTGPELIDFVDNKLIPVLKGDSINVDGKSKVIFDSTEDRALLVKQVMGDAMNLMKNGYFLREVVNLFNEVDLAETSDSHDFSEMYEGLLDGLQAMGKYGEFHTIRAITRFAVDKVNPKLGETMADWACGTGGFMVDTIEHLRKQVRLGNNDDFEKLQNAVRGGEFKPMPFRLCITNLLLHGIDLPNVRYGDSLDIKNFSEYFSDDQVDVACLNPPYGGVASDSDKLSFPADMRSSETADLFVALTVKRLKKNGRAIVVVPDGFLYGTDNAIISIKKYLLKECNLHTIIRLPQSCFAPYTSIATNLLFFDKTGSTGETWFYRLDMPEEYKHFSKTKPMKREHFAPVDAWWNNRVEIKDIKTDDSMTESWKSKKCNISDFEVNGYDLNFCGYPTVEKVILSPEETLNNYIERKRSLEEKLEKAISGIDKYLKGNYSIDLFNIGSINAELVKLNTAFPSDFKASLIQTALEGKLTERNKNDSTIAVNKEEISENYDTLDIPEEWQWNTIGSLIDVKTGLTYNKQDQKPAGPDTLRILRGGNILDNYQYGLFDNDVYVTYRDKYIVLQVGDVISPAVTSMEKMCKVAYIDKELHNTTAGGFVYILRSKDVNILNPRYMMYFFNSNFNRINCNENIHKSGQAFYNLKKSGMITQPIPLPPIEEQERIVELLDKLLPLCESLE